MRDKRLLALALVLALVGGFCAGWWYRNRTDESVEQRAHLAAEQMRDAVRSLTR
jgi:hypothetical protein